MTVSPLPGPTRRAARAVLALVAVAVGVLGGAAPAYAHANLLSTDPAEGAVLTEAPERVRFTFSERVSAVPDGVHVFSASGDELAATARASGSVLDVVLEESVGDGTVVVAWRVISEDGHPVSGSLRFSVGAPSADVVEVPTSTSESTRAPSSLSVVRWIGYVGLFLAAGAVGFLVLLLPSGRETDRARRRLVTVARGSAAVAVLGWLAALPLVAAYQLGTGFGSVTKGSTWTALDRTEYVVTGAVVVGICLAVLLLGRGAPVHVRAVAAVVAAGLAAVAPALTGHTRAASPEALVVLAAGLHLLAGCIWLGGLVALALTLHDLAGHGDLAARVLVRFSIVAAATLAALGLTGSLLAWRILGSWSALVETGYGQLLLLKILAALVVAVVAAWNRFALAPRLHEASRRRERRTSARVLARTTAAEASVLVAVLLATGFLVDRSPEPSPSSADRAATARLGDIELRVTASPLTTGPNTFTVRMRDATGEPFEGLEAPVVRVSSGQVDLGSVPSTNIGPGTYTAAAVIPSPGTWRLQVSLRITEFDNPVATVEFEVE